MAMAFRTLMIVVKNMPGRLNMRDVLARQKRSRVVTMMAVVEMIQERMIRMDRQGE
jgi:hypothetical protein